MKGNGWFVGRESFRGGGEGGGGGGEEFVGDAEMTKMEMIWMDENTLKVSHVSGT